MPVRVRPSAPSLSLLGVVLAGGEGRRLGTDKARLPLEGPGGPTTLARRAAETLARVCPEVVIADRGRATSPPWPSIADGPGAGPAAGLLGAAEHTPGAALLVLACDLPRVPESLLRTLVVELGPPESAASDVPGTFDWVVVESPRGLEPLCAAYGPKALAALRRRVDQGSFALHALAEEPNLAVQRLRGAELEAHGDPASMLLNLNRPEDLEWLRELGPA